MKSLLRQAAPRASAWATRLTRALGLASALALAACSGESVESLLASGQSHMAKGEAQAAVISFKSALQLNPQSTEARVQLGLALLKASDPAAAVVELSKAMDQQAEATRVVPALARALLLTGEYKKITTLYGDMVLPDAQAQAALKATLATAWAAQGDRAKTSASVDAALQAVPNYPPALVLQARIEAGRNQFDKAHALLDQALKADPKLHEAWHPQGELHAYTKRDDKAAVAAFRKALAIEPSYMAAHLALVSERIRARDLDGAQAQVNELRKFLPNHPQTTALDAQLAFWRKDFKRARELTQALLRILPNSADIQHLAGAVEAQLGSLIFAEAHFAKAMQINPRLYLARRNLAQVYLQLGQPRKSLETLQPLLAAGIQDAHVYELAGRAHLVGGDAANAEAAFKQAIAIKPDQAGVKTALALTHLTRGDADTAFAELQAIASASGKDTFADQAIVSARLSRREYDAALAAVNAMLAKDGGKASTLEQRGRIQRLRRDLVAARADFEAALKADPAHFSAVVSLGSLDLQEKKPEQARKRFEASLQTEPRNHYARLALVDLRLSQDAPLDELKALLAEGIKLSPTEPSLHLASIEVLLRKRQFKDAMASAQNAAAALPDNVAVLDAVGRAQAESGEIEQAISTFRRVADANQRSAAPYLRLAQIYSVTNRKPAAESALRKALEVEPDSAAAQQALASLMLGTGRLREALDLARGMQTQRPRAASGYAFEATVHLRQKNLDAALTTYRRGLAVKDHDPELARQFYLTLLRGGRTAEGDRFGAGWIQQHPNDMSFEYQMAVVALRREDYPQAEARLRRVVGARPRDAVALNNLAWVLATRGQPGGSAFALQALEVNPDSPSFLDTLALAYMAEKTPAKALESQRRAVELAPTNPAYRLSLARIAIEAGDKTLARAEIERLKALGSSYPQQAEVAALAKKL